MYFWDVIQLILLVVVTLFVLLGWGRIGKWALRINTPAGFDVDLLWLGLSFLLCFLEIVHLFVAINWKITLLIFSIGMCGLLRSIKSLYSQKWLDVFHRKLTPRIWLFLIISVTFFIIYTLRSMGVVNNYDSGIYHFGSIKWANEYPIVPGLGNVFTALAYNQSYFLFLGLLNIAPYWNHGYALAGLVLLLMTGLSLTQFCMRGSIVLRWSFGVPIFIFLGYLGGTLSNPSPDSAVSLLQIVMFLSLITLYNSKEIQNEKQPLLVSTLIVLSITVVTIKISSAMFALTTLGLTLFYVNKDFYINGNWKPVLFICLIIGATHLIRGYLLSGAPLYPSDIGSLLNLPWAMSPDSIFGERFWIYIWSRKPGAMPAEVIGTWAWFPHWINALSYEVWIFASVLVCLSFVNVWLIFSNTASVHKYKSFSLTIPLVSSIVFWFISAPQIRFLGAMPMLLLSLNLWILGEIVFHKKCINNSIHFKHRTLLFWIVIVSTCLISLKLIGLRAIHLDGWAVTPSVITKNKITSTGVSVNMPIDGNQCWESDLPCSPQVKDELALMEWPSGFLIFELLKKRPIYRLKY